LEEIKSRFKLTEEENNVENPNIFILKKAKKDNEYGKTNTIGQIFVDLWNLKEWYAGDFLKALEEKINKFRFDKSEHV